MFLIKTKAKNNNFSFKNNFESKLMLIKLQQQQLLHYYKNNERKKPIADNAESNFEIEFYKFKKPPEYDSQKIRNKRKRKSDILT